MTRIDSFQADTQAEYAAGIVAAHYLSPALYNHSMRTWKFALALAKADGMSAIDRELLQVAALLHDVGLVPEFDAARVPFETTGGHLAWVLTAGAGWKTYRRDRVIEVIERHMLPSVDRADDPEGHLLEMATSLDISGARLDVLPSHLITEVVSAHPRLDFASEFGKCLADQAVRKPASQAARLISRGLQARLDAHPLEQR
ncbi:HD domain-containing protein [Paenarthrobacter sp. PH39-S1]|uniref:HD domain-containing protein n=1 Tax=Paenarthrobacter sp. PH39-S1 TaxID=3046204 RepID=UPI0024B911AA|nr:HD domain-containing protein [Paenarthrobacter sp. PH39-S1]MDJ0356660.1 HD domain-containing protein [Paenarthrobacter sp. PH39-S1]